MGQPDRPPWLTAAPSWVSQPGTPESLVADAVTGTLAVAVRSPAGVVLRDLATGEIRMTVPLAGAARHLVLARPGGPLLVPDEERDLLDRLTLPTVGVGRQPHGAAALADGAVLVGDELADTAHLIQPGRDDPDRVRSGAAGRRTGAPVCLHSHRRRPVLEGARDAFSQFSGSFYA